MDSISVESQAEFCRRETAGQQVKIYTDKGYSGKNMDRPAFQELMRDLEAGQVRRVIVYRLDRISRSVLDFANLIHLFQKYQVDFVSTMEKFDTGTPIGKAMLMIVMIFAQLERETIQQRVIDAYSSRSKRGFYMGGRVPFGFMLQDTVIDGIRTKMYAPVDQEAEIVRQIFALYAIPQTSLGDVARYLADRKVTKRDGKPFSRSRLRDIIVNPVYVRADYRLYAFFQSQGTQIVNSPEDFIGTNGAYLYSGENQTRKSVSLEGHTLVLAPHQGLVDAKTWLQCRMKCLQHQGTAKPVKAKATWLAGKIKCAHCGYALTAKVSRCKTKADNRYYLCTHKDQSGGCPSLNANLVDAVVFAEMAEKLAEFDPLVQSCPEGQNLQAIQLNSRIEALDREISALLDRAAAASQTVMEYIDSRIQELDREKQKLCRQAAASQSRRERKGEISGYLKYWEQLSVSDKITVTDLLIERVTASENRLEIKWKF